MLPTGWTPESPERRLHPGGPPLYVAWGSFGRQSDYKALLNDTVFCPQPAGSQVRWICFVIAVFVFLLNRHLRLDYPRYRCNVRWLYTVFIGHATHYVFHDMLDWSKLSLRIEPHEISHMEDLLLSRYSLTTLSGCKGT